LDGGLPIGEDGPAARINVRLPEQLKASVEEAAAKEGRSVNAWLVRAATAALQRSERDQRSESHGSGKRSKQSFTGWVR
jgi:Arc/MetJ-type ribon-helix-helix transcriptional regulator